MTRRALRFVLALILVMGAVTVVTSSITTRQQPTLKASTFNVGPRGLRAVYAALQEAGLPVRRWRRPYAQLPEDAGVLIMASPQAYLSDEEWQDHILPWLTEGRTLILASGLGDPMPFSFSHEGQLTQQLDYGLVRNPQKTEQTDPRQPPQHTPESLAKAIEHVREAERRPEPVAPVQASAFTPVEAPLTLPAFRPLHAYLPAAAPLYADANGPYAWHIPVHGGQVILTATPAWLANAHVHRRHNVEFLLRVHETFAAGRPILFDERAQGYPIGDLSLGDMFARPEWSVALLQFGFLGIWYVLSNGQRFGKPIPLLRPVFRSTLEYVDAMANVYRRAGLHHPALAAQWRSFRVDVAKRYGIAPRAPLTELRSRLLAAVHDLDPAEVDTAFATIGAAMRERTRLRERDLVRTARTIDALRKEVL